MKYSAIFFGLMLMLLLYACGDSSKTAPPDLIPENNYVELLVELQLVRSHSNSLAGNTSVDSLKKLIFEKYEVEEEQFLNSHQYYQSQVEKQLKRVERAMQKLKAELQKIETKFDSLNTDTLGVIDSLETL